MNYDLHTWNYDPRIVNLRSANPPVSDRLRHSHLKLRPLHCQACQVTTRQSPCLWHITILILEIMSRALSNYDRLIPLSVTDYDPRTWNYDPCTLKIRPANPLVCDRLRPSHLKLRPVHSQITTRIPLSVTDYDPVAALAVYNSIFPKRRKEWNLEDIRATFCTMTSSNCPWPSIC